MRQKAFSPAVLSKKPFFKLHMLHMPDAHQAYDVFFSFFELLRPFSANEALKKARARSALLREIVEHRVIFKLDLLPDAAVPVFQNHGIPILRSHAA